MKAFSLIIALGVAQGSLARVNDWDKPCFHGECAYDTPGTAESGYGSIKLYGSPKTITDITPAAGWVILDCDPNVLAQDIRLVCQSDDEEGCQHIFSHDGPMNKIVRLPESCGKGSFARIASMKVADDQSIPIHAESRIARRDGLAPQVHVLTIDTDFDAAPADSEPVSFIVAGGNIPGFYLDESMFNGVEARDLDNIFKAIGHAISKAANAVKDVAVKVGTAVKDVAEKLNNIDINKTFHAPPLNLEKKLDLLDLKQHCGSSEMELKVSVEGKAHAEASLGGILMGHIIPPKVTKAGVFAQLTAELGARLLVKALLNGDLDSGKKQIAQMGFPGLSVPPLFELGPWFELDAEIKGHLDLDIDVDVGFNWGIHDVSFWFPPGAGPSTQKDTKPKDTPLKLSASADVSAKGSIEFHAIPALKLGISVLAGKAKADVYLNADAYAKFGIDAQASLKHRSLERELNDKLYIPPYDHVARAMMARAQQEKDGITFNGCVDLKGGIGLGGGAEGDIFGLWKGDKHFNFFTKEFQIFKKCWGTGKAKRHIESSLTRRRVDGLSCPKGQPPTSIDSTTVKASDIH
ncbi:hypothetical protein ONZ45_g7073 [Pleurotus djamor]|nr:hypothetical protein ONZ45_g7073 [Pleurotus djamor]